MSSWPATAYARSFAKLCAGTHDPVLTGLGTPGTLLDAGCGTGDLAVAAAARGWDVTAVDSDVSMVTATRERCRGLPVRVVGQSIADLAPRGRRPGAKRELFDAVAANLVVNHVADPGAAVRALRRVTRPGGLVALTTWTSEPTPQAVLFAESFRAARAEPSAQPRPADGKDFERSASGLAGLVREAGLEPVVQREISWEWAVAWDDLWAGISGGVATVGRRYLAQDDTTRKRVESEMRLRATEVDGLIRLPSRAAYVMARVPGASGAAGAGE